MSRKDHNRRHPHQGVITENKLRLTSANKLHFRAKSVLQGFGGKLITDMCVKNKQIKRMSHRKTKTGYNIYYQISVFVILFVHYTACIIMFKKNKFPYETF